MVPKRKPIRARSGPPTPIRGRVVRPTAGRVRPVTGPSYAEEVVHGVEVRRRTPIRLRHEPPFRAPIVRTAASGANANDDGPTTSGRATSRSQPKHLGVHTTPPLRVSS